MSTFGQCCPVAVLSTPISRALATAPQNDRRFAPLIRFSLDNACRLSSWRRFPPDLLSCVNRSGPHPSGKRNLIYCYRHETERRSQSLRHNGLCHASSRHLYHVINSDGWGSRYRFTFIAAFGRFMRRSRIPKHFCRYIYSRCEVRSCGALAGAQTLGVDFKDRMGAGNPLSPRHADSIRAADQLWSP